MAPSRRAALVAAATILGVGLGGSPSWAGGRPDPVIAVAASLRPAIEAVLPLFEASAGGRVRVTYGATGNLVRQIESGAPFELFLAADEASVARLEAAGYTVPPSRVLVRGEIVVATARGSEIGVDAALEGLARALAAGTVRRIAIANPELAPYGVAAREALTAAGLWRAAEPRLALAENVAQAAQFVASGAADVGFIARSSAVSADLAPVLRFAAVRDDWYRPIDQRMAVLKGAGPVARAFAAFLGGVEARAVLERSGFKVP